MKKVEYLLDVYPLYDRDLVGVRLLRYEWEETDDERLKERTSAMLVLDPEPHWEPYPEGETFPGTTFALPGIWGFHLGNADHRDETVAVIQNAIKRTFDAWETVLPDARVRRAHPRPDLELSHE